ncbi:MAG: hypothetical protein JST84_21545 [Acidobacteria bacterium]|nr:hypothetical protein [Acidobacteriota bacterium]MBS1810763.1 hypothetical protein [Acidobacteriota bacterium]
MTSMNRPKINPLSRRPRQQRLVMAVRGGAGVGKSFFAASLADAGLGRLCIIDTERKTRLLHGVGEMFDGLEVEHPGEVPEFVDWLLNSPEAAEQNYGCYALDSWASYFSAKHSEMIAAVRERTGDPLAQPNAEELAADQMVLQGVLRSLCQSGKSVVIVDQIPAKGKETKEDNEMGRVLPSTASGLEYFVDIMCEVSLQERNGEVVRVFQIVKSNSPAFELGFEMTGNVTFKDFLDHLVQRSGSKLPVNTPAPLTVAETLPTSEPLKIVPPQISVEDLLAKAVQYGFKQSDIVTAAKIYHQQPNIYHLTSDQLADLDRRMSAKIEKMQATNHAVPEEISASGRTSRNGLRRAS